MIFLIKKNREAPKEEASEAMQDEESTLPKSSAAFTKKRKFDN